jgi:hypothetical protein
VPKLRLGSVHIWPASFIFRRRASILATASICGVTTANRGWPISRPNLISRRATPQAGPTLTPRELIEGTRNKTIGGLVTFLQTTVEKAERDAQLATDAMPARAGRGKTAGPSPDSKLYNDVKKWTICYCLDNGLILSSAGNGADLPDTLFKSGDNRDRMSDSFNEHAAKYWSHATISQRELIPGDRFKPDLTGLILYLYQVVRAAVKAARGGS